MRKVGQPKPGAAEFFLGRLCGALPTITRDSKLKLTKHLWQLRLVDPANLNAL